LISLHLSYFATPWWQDLLSQKAMLCAAAAVLLLVLMLLLRGLQKLLGLLAVVLLAAAGYWYFKNPPATIRSPIPPELISEFDHEAERILKSSTAKNAWQAAKQGSVAEPLKSRLAAGGQAARQWITSRLEAESAKLRKSGQKIIAEELQQLRQKIEAKK
jgi:gamma-glutamyl:cysteine ligase YbdK (ATP-grasp superfamily)